MSLEECRGHLRAFARLLVEIDTGKRLPSEEDTGTDEDLIWTHIQEIRDKGREPYDDAIKGAWNFMKTHRNTRYLKLTTIRQKIYDFVLAPLQRYYLPHSYVMENAQGGPYEIPAIISRPTGQAQQARVPIPTSTRRLPNMAYFDDSLQEGRDQYVCRSAFRDGVVLS